MPAFVSSALTSSDSASRPPADEPIATTGNVLPPNGPTPRLSVATSTRAVSGTTVESASPRPTHAHRRRGRNPNCSRSPNIYECGRHLLHSLIDPCSFPVTFPVRMARFASVVARFWRPAWLSSHACHRNNRPETRNALKTSVFMGIWLRRLVRDNLRTPPMTWRVADCVSIQSCFAPRAIYLFSRLSRNWVSSVFVSRCPGTPDSISSRHPYQHTIRPSASTRAAPLERNRRHAWFSERRTR